MSLDMTEPDRPYQECTFCVMDTTDPRIEFDAMGRCNHCRDFERVAEEHWFPNEEGGRRLDGILDRIRAEGRGKQYDSILGLSGGVDSSYLALKVHEWGLRPLVVHVDGGWNSELAVQNIERVVKHTGFELHTHVVDWEDMRALQLSYLRAAVPNQDVPQDHAFFAGLYHFAVRNDVKFVLNGGNLATEGIFPTSWHGPAMDSINLKDIHRRFGDRPLKNYPTIGVFRYFVWYPLVRGMTPIRPLNYVPYSKDIAIAYLQDTVGWRAYERKHGESLFTKFFQNYYLPTKFGLDKRRPHLSSLIVAGSLTRDEAAKKLAEPLYDPAELKRDREYLSRKLRLGPEGFEELMAATPHHHTDFRTWDPYYRVLSRSRTTASKLTGRSLRIYTK